MSRVSRPTLPGLVSTSTTIMRDLAHDNPQLHDGYCAAHRLTTAGSLDASARLSSKHGGFFSPRIIGKIYQWGCALRSASAVLTGLSVITSSLYVRDIRELYRPIGHQSVQGSRNRRAWSAWTGACRRARRDGTPDRWLTANEFLLR